jgi:hypothetical protein
MGKTNIQFTQFRSSSFNTEVALLQAGKLHLLCEAAEKAGGRALHYLTDALGIDRDTAIKYIKKVNEAEECASLHPKYAFSMFPAIPLADPNHDIEERFIAYLHELIFEANEILVKADTMLFAFDSDNTPPFDWFKEMVSRTIARALETAGLELVCLRTIKVMP